MRHLIINELNKENAASFGTDVDLVQQAFKDAFNLKISKHVAQFAVARAMGYEAFAHLCSFYEDVSTKKWRTLARSYLTKQILVDAFLKNDISAIEKIDPIVLSELNDYVHNLRLSLLK